MRANAFCTSSYLGGADSIFSHCSAVHDNKDMQTRKHPSGINVNGAVTPLAFHKRHEFDVKISFLSIRPQSASSDFRE